MKRRRHFKAYVFVKLSCPVILLASLMLGASCLKQEGHLWGAAAGFQVGPHGTAGCLPLFPSWS